MLIRLIVSVAAVLAFAAGALGQTKLLRFPDIHGDRVVFTYGGDLWTTSTSGGTATRLTAHPGVETYAKFSPDGQWIAFTGQYDGDEQVYVMPSGGGEPKQLTFYPSRGPLAPRWGFDNQVLGWTKDGRIFYRGGRDSWSLPIARLYTVSPNGGPSEALPMPEAGSGSFSPDGTKMVYSPRFRDFRPEKRYSGGQANKLYIYDLKTNDAQLISDSPFASRDAMWIGDTVYYNTDKDGKFNLWAYDPGSKKTTQVTKNRDWDIRWPSSDHQSKIVYERNGELETFDVGSKKAARLSITVPDDGINKRPRQTNVANRISWFGLSPKGERAVFSARGDIFTVPIEKGGARNLTHSSGAHDRFPIWSPDGRWIAYMSDQSGEDEVWIVAQDGSTQPQQITTGGSAQRYAPQWSGDSKKIVFGDKNGRVYVVTVATKEMKMITDAPNGQITDYEFSPKGNYVSYSTANSNGVTSVYIWSSEDNKNYRVTPDMFSSHDATWDPSGGYLYFLSDREYAPMIGTTEFNYASNRSTYVYALSLRKDSKNPFPAESDEVAIVEEKKEGAPAPSPSPSPASTGPEKIDFDGIESRASKAPLGADNYGGIAATKGHLVYTINAPFYYGRQADTQASVRIFSLKDRKETTLLTGTGALVLSADGSKLMSVAMGTYLTMDANPATGERSRKNISTANMIAEIDPAKEWRQIFFEVWRQYRDWFYAPNMHGYDWVKIREDYLKWLPYVNHRSDLNYLLSEMQSELQVQHAYIDGGDFNLPPRVRVALTGARFEADKGANRYRISKIFAGENEEDIYRSPFTEVGSEAKVGEYVLAINGEDVTTDRDIYSYLRGKADSTVTFTLNSTPTTQGSHTVTIKPITSESDLVYLDWIQDNRHRVDQLSGGRLGYIHIPDMGAAGIREFIKWYYPQLRKEGLVVDVRANGGGNISRMLIERLRRKVLGINYNNFSEDGNTYPDGAFNGPMIALLNENSASDGDIFPYMFRGSAGLGQLVGKRSWGGVVGISNRGTLMDGGVVNVPQSALANPQGEYIIEGHGVDPDIEVDNDPKSVLAGHDPQLERAVAELMKKLTSPNKLPGRPKDPMKAGN